MKDRYYLKILIQVRKNLPTSISFYFIYFSFKLLGFILSTQNIQDYESKDNNITSLYSILSKFLFFDSSFNLISKNYQYNCMIIFVLLTLVTIYIIFLFLRLRKNYLNFEKRKDFSLMKYLNKQPYFKIEMKIITYVLIIISFISQYIQEYLFFGILIKFNNDSNNNLNLSDSYISDFFANSIKVNKTFILVANIISFLICFSIDFFIIFINDTKGLFNNFSIDIYSNQYIKICYMFLIILQPIIGNSYLYKKDFRKKIRLDLNVISILLSSIYLILTVKYFTFYFDSLIPKFILFSICFGWYSGIFEILMHLFIKDTDQISQNYSIIKLILNLTSSIFIYSLIQNKNLDFYSKNLIKNIFKNDEKKRYIGEYYLFIKYFCKYRKDPSNFELYKILYTHKKQCETKECFCLLIKKKLNIKKISNCLKKDEYAIIGEQEIVNRIHYLYKIKNYKEIEDYIVLHCQYIYAIRKREYYALYLCTMYLNSKFKISLLTKYFLCELKKQIMIKIQSDKDIQKGDLLLGNLKNIEHNLYYKILKMKQFSRFIIFIDNIKSLIETNLKFLEKVLSYRKLITKNSKLGKMNEKSFEHFLTFCSKVKLNDEYIKKTIINYSKIRKEENPIIKNNEISYILTNYFFLLHKKIPTNLENKFVSNFDFNSISDTLKTDFLEFNMDLPIIISQNKNDSFTISYISDLLSNLLGFNQEEIKERDFNELIPFELRKEHLLLLKQFTQLYNSKFKTPYSYILTKSNNLINISFHSRCLPNLKYFFDIIINIRINENQNNNSLYYHIFLDKNGYFMNTCKEFEDNFFFNIKQLKQLEISFSNFFGIQNLEKKNIKENQPNIFSEEDKAHTIFSTIPNEKMFRLRKKKKNVQQFRNKKYIFSTEISKKNVISAIHNLNHILDEKGLDNEWYVRINCLAQRFQISEKNSKKLKKKKTKVNFNEEENYLFYIDYQLKSMGNKRYYIIKMTEKIDAKILKKTTLNLKKLITENKRVPILQSNTVISTTKSTEVSPVNSQYSSHTNVPLIQNENLDSQNLKSNLNIITNNSFSLNNSLLNNSKNPFIDDSKGGISGLNLIQNLANNEIERINQINQSNNRINLNSNNNTIPKKFIKFPNFNKTKPLNKRNKLIQRFLRHYTLFLFLSFGVVIALSIILIILKLKKIYAHKELFQFNVYIEILKTDTYLSALNSLTLCFQSTYNNLPIDDKTFISPKISSLQDNIAKFNIYIDKIKGNNKLKVLYDYLYGESYIGEIGRNWDIIYKPSNLFDELKLILFDMNKIYFNDINYCDFWLFSNFSFVEKSIEDPEPSDLQKFTFYGMINTLQTFKITFENITTVSSEILLNYYKSYFHFITIYGILIICFTFICYLIILEKLTNDKNEIKKLMLYLFDIGVDNYNQIIFENQIYCFQLMCKNFIGENITKYEHSKNEDIEIILKNLNKNHLKKGRKSTHSLKKNEKQTKEDNYENINETNKNIFLPKSVTISYIILTFFTLIIIIVVIINIIYAYSNKNKFIFTVIMAMNFLERIPKCFEITYYVLISMISINPSFIGRYDNFQESHLTDKYLNYYNTEFYFENNSQIYNMKESYFPILFLEGKMVENNLEIFIGKENSILSNVKKYEKEFNGKENFCYTASIASLERVKDSISDVLRYFTLANQKVNLCYIYNPGSMKSGLLVELNYIYQELTNIYYDFLQSNDKSQSALYYITGTDINRITLDFDYIFEYVFRTYSHFVLKDIDSLYILTIQNECLISIILLITLLFIVIYVFLWIGRGNKRYKSLLMFFYKMY